MKKRFMIFVCVIFLILPCLVQAKDEKKDEESIATMEEVVVTATKTEEKRKDIPNSVILIDAIDIQESPATSLGELLANELGIDWRTYGDYGGAVGEIYIRGMGGDATQIFVNGVSVNSPSIGSADVGRIPLNNIERIEVVKGSGSLLYGTGAMGGTVNIITKRPERDKMDLKARAGYGSENTYEVSAEQGMFISGDFGYYLAANRRETDGFRDNGDLIHNDVSLKLVLDKGDALDISLYGDYIDREYGVPGVEPPPGTEDYFVNGEKFYNSEAASLVNRGGDEATHVVLQVKGKPARWIEFSLKGDCTSMENYYLRRDANPWWPNLPGEGEKTWVTNKIKGVEGNVDLKLFKGINLLAGAEYKDYDYERENEDLDINGIPKPGTKDSADYNVHTKGVYSEIQYRPYDYFKALVGIRHEDHSMFGSINLPRYGIIVNPTGTTAVKLSTGKHFKAPTMNELYWPEDDYARGNPDLEPEEGWHANITVEQSLFDEKLFFEVSYFEWDIDNKIGWAENPNYPGPWGNKWTPSNVNSYEANGLEVGTNIKPIDQLMIGLYYTYTDAKEEKSDSAKRQATYTPEHQFKANLTYWFDFGLTVTTISRYVSDRPAHYLSDTDTKPDFILSSYWTTDIKIEQRLHDHWILSLQANNMFDEEYDTYAENFTDQSTSVTTMEGYPGAGRSVFFSVSYEY